MLFYVRLLSLYFYRNHYGLHYFIWNYCHYIFILIIMNYIILCGIFALYFLIIMIYVILYEVIILCSLLTNLSDKGTLLQFCCQQMSPHNPCKLLMKTYMDCEDTNLVRRL